MAKKVKRGGALGGLKDKLAKALQSHAQDETEYRQELINLPPGITRGIAQLTEAKTGKYKSGPNQGEMFVYLAGTVVEPRSVTVVRRVYQDGGIVALPAEVVEVEGQFTSQTMPVCDTNNRDGEITELDIHVGRMLNELRKLGSDTSEVADEESLEAVLADLKEAQPFFRFSTSAGSPSKEFPTERVWENWYGNKDLEDYEPEESEEVEEEEEEEDVEDEEDETEDATDEEGEEDEEDIEEEEEETDIPEKEEVYNYKPPKARKFVECEVTAVFEKKQTVNLKSLDDGKVFKGVSWDKLEEVE